MRAAIATWPPGIRPVVHWSESQEGRKAHAHSDFIEARTLLALVDAQCGGAKCDCMSHQIMGIHAHRQGVLLCTVLGFQKCAPQWGAENLTQFVGAQATAWRNRLR